MGTANRLITRSMEMYARTNHIETSYQNATSCSGAYKVLMAGLLMAQSRGAGGKPKWFGSLLAWNYHAIGCGDQSATFHRW